MRINCELDLAFSDPASVKQLEKIVFRPDFLCSHMLRLNDAVAASNSIAETFAAQL